MFATFRAARFSADPRAGHLKGAKTILHYLHSTPTHGLLYKKANLGQDKIPITTYCDADFAGGVDCVSTMGILVYTCGNLIDWCSQKIRTVVASAPAAELLGLYEAYHRTMWLADLLEEVGFTVATPRIFCDCKPVIQGVTSVMPSKQRQSNRLTRAKLHVLRDAYQQKVFKLEHVAGDETPADNLTKANQLYRSFAGCREQYMCCDIDTVLPALQ